ncbi:hypothetical protein AOC46_05385 [Listeria monocytogenes]|nr:hypothetical protein [Listeria monocytogenes]
MYSVRLYQDYRDLQGVLIHSPYSSGEKLSSAKLKLKLVGIDEFVFSLSPQNIGFGRITPLTSLIKVFYEKTGEVVFSGRVLKPTFSMSSEGQFNQEYICESKLAYLYDSSQRYLELKNAYKGTYFSKIMERHNRAVEPHKRFKIGQVTIKNDEPKNRWIGYEKTYDTIRDNLLTQEGAYLRMRIEKDGTYLDFLDTAPMISDTKLEIKKNLKSVSREIDTSNIATRIIPLGEIIESSDGDASPRLTIASLNKGVDYLDHIALQAEFGVIEETVIWDDVASARELMNRATAYMESQRVSLEAWSVTALDLSLAGYKYSTFQVGESYLLVNPYIAPVEALQVVEKEIDLLNPVSSSLVIGEKRKALTQYQVNAKQVKSELTRLKGNITSQQAKVTLLSDNIVSVSETLSVVQKNLEDANLADISNQLQLVQVSLEQVEQKAASKSSLELLRGELETFQSSQELWNEQISARLANLEGGD